MRIEKVGMKQFLIFVNNLYYQNLEFTKDNLITFTKDLLLKLKNRLFLQGFYKVKVYVNKNLGLFLEILELERFEYENNLDFKIIIYLEEKIYFKTKDYFILPQNTTVYWDKNFYYCDVDLVSNINSLVEFGEFIYGKSLYSAMRTWHLV